MVKQRVQMSQFKTAPDAVRLIVAKEGIKGLYAVCIFQTFSHMTIFFVSYFVNADELCLLGRSIFSFFPCTF